MHSTSPVVVPGPLAPFAAGFDAELARLGYTPDSAYGQLRLAAEFSAWLAGAGIGLPEVTAETLEVFVAGRRAGGHSRRASLRARPAVLHADQRGAHRQSDGHPQRDPGG